MSCAKAIAKPKWDSKQSGILSILFDPQLLLEEVDHWEIGK